MPDCLAILLTVGLLTPPTCPATALAFGLALSAAMIFARFFGGRDIRAGLPTGSWMPARLAILQTVKTDTPPTCLATAFALGLALSAAMIFARFFGGRDIRAAFAAARLMPDRLATFQTVATHTPPTCLATALALGFTLSAVKIFARASRRAVCPVASLMPDCLAMFQTVATHTPPTCPATSFAFGFALSAAMIFARFSGGSILPSDY